MFGFKKKSADQVAARSKGVDQAIADPKGVDFGLGDYGQNLTRAYGFLLRSTKVLNYVIIAWAVAAGIAEGGLLSTHLVEMFKTNTPPWSTIAIWFGPIIGILAYAIRAYAVAILIGIAAACAGGFLGFLFGLPKPSSQPGSQTPINNTSRWQASTNLNEIADWLTKIIVGVGLVEIKTITNRAETFSKYVGDQLFNGLVGAGLILPAIMLAGLILGFVSAYLFTQLFLAGLLKNSWDNLNANSVAEIASIPPTNSVIAPNLLAKDQGGPVPNSTGAPAAVSAQPTVSQKAAAESIKNVPLDAVTDPPMVRLWARAQAVLSQYPQAIAGYAKLLQTVRTPDVLAEAARVYGASNMADKARNLMLEAAEKRDGAGTDTKISITFDAANLRLYDDPPSGFQKALELLDDNTVNIDQSGRLYVLRACANGQNYQFNQGKMLPDLLEKIRKLVIADLKASLIKNRKLLEWVRYLIDPAQKSNRTSGAVKDDDLDFLTDAEVADILAVAEQE